MSKRVKSIDPQAALLRAADICSRAEHCESEIREKLFNWGLEPTHHDQIIDYLFDHKYIDTERFARAFTNDKVRFSGWGRIKIRLALRQKHIPSYAIDQAIEQIDLSTYLSNLNTMILSRSKRYDIDDYEERNKICRQMMSRGYEPALIIQAINDIRSQR